MAEPSHHPANDSTLAERLLRISSEVNDLPGGGSLARELLAVAVDLRGCVRGAAAIARELYGDDGPQARQRVYKLEASGKIRWRRVAGYQLSVSREELEKLRTLLHGDTAA